MSQKQEEEIVRCHKNRCSRQADEIAQLKLKLMSRDEEVAYLQQKLAEKDKSLRETSELHNLKSKAAISGLWESLKTLEEKVENRKETMLEECRRLERLLTGLEQHAMQGHHLCSSRTAIGLFMKIRECLREMKATGGEDENAVRQLNKLSESIETKVYPFFE